MNIALDGREQRRRVARLRWTIGIIAFAGLVATFIWMATTRFQPAPTPPSSPRVEKQIGPALTDTSALQTVPYTKDTTTVPSPSDVVRDTAVVAGVIPPTPYTEPGTLLIPVAGVKPEQLRDTYNEARSEGRVHNAIDIMAPQGTPVLAAADGKIVKFFQSERGGTTIYQLGNDQKTVYYYAHLQRYADGLAEGAMVHQGDTIAYVGDTGDAGPGNYHLHFGITIVDDPKHYWGGIDVNPYPLLHREK